GPPSALGSSHETHRGHSHHAAHPPPPPRRQRRPAAAPPHRLLPHHPRDPAPRLGHSLGRHHAPRVDRELVRDPRQGSVSRGPAHLPHVVLALLAARARIPPTDRRSVP